MEETLCSFITLPILQVEEDRMNRMRGDDLRLVEYTVRGLGRPGQSGTGQAGDREPFKVVNLAHWEYEHEGVFVRTANAPDYFCKL